MENNTTSLQTLQNWIAEAQNIVFFGGAGVSTESGIPDFRSVDGLYQQKYAYPPETILSHTFFTQHTDDFFAFYHDKMLYPHAKPNPAHIKLAEWEQQGKLSAVITQNIDGLHQMAGSQNVLELHGSVHRNTCQRCGKPYDLAYVAGQAGTPHCTCGGVIKPDVVLYEEGLDDEVVDYTCRALVQADLLIVGGTSLAVYPAASFLQHYRGNRMVLINKTETSADSYANLVLHTAIGELFAQL